MGWQRPVGNAATLIVTVIAVWAWGTANDRVLWVRRVTSPMTRREILHVAPAGGDLFSGVFDLFAAVETGSWLKNSTWGSQACSDYYP
jgi:hypothetical protein